MPLSRGDDNPVSSILPEQHPDAVTFRDGMSNTNPPDDNHLTFEAEDEPIAPIRPPIHSKTKNWYSGFCNRWASLIGVSIFCN